MLDPSHDPKWPTRTQEAVVRGSPSGLAIVPIAKPQSTEQLIRLDDKELIET
jgi:hypothetical protein